MNTASAFNLREANQLNGYHVPLIRDLLKSQHWLRLLHCTASYPTVWKPEKLSHDPSIAM
jgi:hypothetical protein